MIGLYLSHMHEVSIFIKSRKISRTTLILSLLCGCETMIKSVSFCNTKYYRTTVTSARIPEEDACQCMRNLYVFSHVQKGTPRLTHKGCVLQRASLGAISDVTVVLGMRQSIDQPVNSLEMHTGH